MGYYQWGIVGEVDGGEVVPSGGHFCSLVEQVGGWVDGDYYFLAGLC